MRLNFGGVLASDWIQIAARLDVLFADSHLRNTLLHMVILVPGLVNFKTV